MKATPTPFFLDTPHGRLFAVHHAPDDRGETWGQVLVVPAFNEEMNRCRSMVTLQAQALAAIGLGTLVLDLHGTGESDGEYGDGRWDIWLDDIGAAIRWLDGQAGACVALLGIRLGALLAADVLKDRPSSCRGLIVWQPVIDGKSYFTQFLRMRLAANMDRTDVPKETTADMRNRLAAGECVEVAGYSVHPELAGAIEKARLADLAAPEEVALAWFEKSAAAEAELSPASQNVLAAWRAPGRRVHVELFDGAAFWALHDRVTVPKLIEATAAWAAALRDTP